ncbi:hypothetical protein SUGI_0194190 [Cryptomeria japonica]|nr:hypothetical protein SUGI_0194190 [Cryptomeria japonica]
MSKSHTNFAEQKDFLCNSLALFFLCNFLALIFLCNFLDLDFEWRRKQAKSKRGRSMMGSACKGRITEEFGSGGGENGRPRCDSRGIDRASGLAPSTQLKALPWHMTRPVSAGEESLETDTAAAASTPIRASQDKNPEFLPNFMWQDWDEIWFNSVPPVQEIHEKEEEEDIVWESLLF